MTRAGLAAEAERDFAQKPHVGSVRHFEGMELEAFAERVRRLAGSLGLSGDDAIEEVQGRPTFNAVFALPVGGGMSLWIVAREEHGLAVKAEARIFHALEESAQADEYLARLGEELEREPGAGTGPGDGASRPRAT